MNIYTRRNALRLGTSAIGFGELGALAGCATTPENAADARQNVGTETYSEDEIVRAGNHFFASALVLRCVLGPGRVHKSSQRGDSQSSQEASASQGICITGIGNHRMLLQM